MIQRRHAASRFLTISGLLLLLLPLGLAAESADPDPSGARTGGIADIPRQAPSPEPPTAAEMGAALGHNIVATNINWVLLTAFLVMFMQAGFAMLESGFCRAKNAAHMFFMNFSVYFLGIIGYWISGFALQMGGAAGQGAIGGLAPLNGEFSLNLFGHSLGLFGTKGFLLGPAVYDVGVFALFVHHMVFLDTAATIPTGAMAERWKSINFIFYCLLMSMFVYPIFGNWVWGGGWLSQLGSAFGLGHGHLDFAGSSAVHLLGGVAALAGAMVLGPRIGKYDKNGRAVPIPGHHLPMAIIGSFILGFGWFGFNTSNTLSGNDLRVSVVVVNTMLASASGALAAMFYLYFKIGKFDPGMTANGFLAGLVSITASCAYVAPWAAFVIGSLAGVLVCVASSFLENVIKIDDPVGAIAVHAFCGAWGIIALGLFADGSYGEGVNHVAGTVRGLFYGDAGQFGAEIIGLISCVLWSFGCCWGFFKLTDKLFGIRVSPEIEMVGLDIPECGGLAYPDFFVKRG
jgi:Amt family ammonium transporter